MITLWVDPDASGDNSGDSQVNGAPTLNALLGERNLTDDETINCLASSGSDDTTPAVIGLIDTTTNYRMTIKDYDGTYRLYIDASAANAVDLTRASAHYYNITFDGIEMLMHSSSANYQQAIDLNDLRQGEFRIVNCKIHEEAHIYRSRLIDIQTNGVTYTTPYIVANNLVICRGTAAHSANAGIYFSGGDPVVAVYNNTFIGSAGDTYCYSGTGDDDNTTFTNNLFEDCGDPGADPGTASYNMFSGAFDFGGTGDDQSQTYTFVDTTDYRLAAGDVGAQGLGTDLSGDGVYAVSTDIDGNARHASAPDAGCSEYTAAGGGNAPTAALMGPLWGPLAGPIGD